MQLKGKVIACLPPRSGASKRDGSAWKSQEFVLDIPDEKYPKKFVFGVFGAERLEKFNIQVGMEVEVFFDIDAHEWNGKWFNDVNAYDVRTGAQIGATQAPETGNPFPAPPPTPTAAQAKVLDAFTDGGVPLDPFLGAPAEKDPF